MKEIINNIESKKIMKGVNIILYGSVRDIEKYFLTCFSNLDLISSYFNKVFIIIFENDSNDETRKLLKSWHLTKRNNVTKHIILMDNLVNTIPKRAHRLAFCRNEILNYIFNGNLDKEYQYAIHIDLDDRFWGIDLDGISNCFQYELTSWDVMTCVNKDKTYYDYWALRTDLCWFNRNIFSCDAKNTYFPEQQTYDFEFREKIYEFELLLEKNSSLIQVQSSFNGFGIYKLSSMKNCFYSAKYHCAKCNNKEIGCFEDNDHVALHNKMVQNGCKIFINTNLTIMNMPKNAIDYQTFISTIANCPNIDKNILLYLLYNDLIDKSGLWIECGTNDGSYTNLLSNYNDETIFSFTENNKENNFIYLNKNITLIEGKIEFSSIDFKKNFLENNHISLLFINYNNYLLTNKIFKNLFDKINNNTTIIFKKFINYSGYIYNQLKVFYEFTQLYNITFEWIGKNSDFNLHSNSKITTENKNIFYDVNEMVAIKILDNPFYLSKNISYNDFNWLLYKYNNVDLRNISNKEEAWLHYINHGINESREFTFIRKNKIHYENFDWKLYLDSYPDLLNSNIEIKEKAWEHYYDHGIFEGRNECIIENNEKINEKEYISFNDFDCELYLELNEDLKKQFSTNDEAYKHWILHGQFENRMSNLFHLINDKINKYDKDDNINKIKYVDFDYKEYLELNRDLRIDKSTNIKLESFKHFLLYGVKEKRKFKKTINDEDNNFEDFDYKTYLDLNLDLKEANLYNKQDAWTHWITYGKEEKRLYAFDWILYIKKFNLDSKNIHNKEKAIKHWLDNGRPTFENKKSEVLLNKDFALFDLDFYKKNYQDLGHLKTKEDGLEHYIKFGKAENRKTNDFNWINYIFINDDLIENGIETEEKAIIHYLNIGKKEKRKYKK